MCHKSNIFRPIYDFLVGQTITLDLHWRTRQYLKRLLWTNIRGIKLLTYKQDSMS